MPVNTYCTVSATALQNSGVVVASGTIEFTPMTTDGVQIPFLYGGGPVSGSGTISAQIENGAFSVQLADTSTTIPKNMCYQVRMTDDSTGETAICLGYETFQPTGAAVAFDTVPPNLAAQVTVQQGPKGPPGDVNKGQLGYTLAVAQAYSTQGSTVTTLGNATSAVDTTIPAGSVVSSAPTGPTVSGYLESVSVPIGSCPQGGTLDILIAAFTSPASYAVVDRFTVTPSPIGQGLAAPGVQTFTAGIDFAPRQVAANLYVGWSSPVNGAKPQYLSTAGNNANLNGVDPGQPGSAAIAYTVGAGTVPVACSIRSLQALATSQSVALANLLTAANTSTSTLGNIATAVNQASGPPVAVAPLAITRSGYLQSISIPIAAAPASATIDVIVARFSQPNSYTILDRFTVSVSGTGVQTFAAGKDYAPRQVSANSFLGVVTNGTATFSFAAGSGGFALFNGDPGPVSSSPVAWTIENNGTLVLGCTIETINTNLYNGKTLFSIGDSIAAGYASSTGTFDFAAEAAGILGMNYKGRNATPGIAAGQIFATLSNHNPPQAADLAGVDWVLLEIGTNQLAATLGAITDAPLTTDVSGSGSFYAQMRGLIEALLPLNPNARVVGLLPYQNGNNNSTPNVSGGFGGHRDNSIMSSSGRAWFLQIRAALMEIYTFYGIPWIDLWTAFGINYSNASTFLAADFVHPNDVGYDLLAKSVAKAMLSLNSSFVNTAIPAGAPTIAIEQVFTASATNPQTLTFAHNLGTWNPLVSWYRVAGTQTLFDPPVALDANTVSVTAHSAMSLLGVFSYVATLGASSSQATPAVYGSVTVGTSNTTTNSNANQTLAAVLATPCSQAGTISNIGIKFGSVATGSTLRILILSQTGPAQSFTVENSFSVTPSAVGFQNFVAGTDFASGIAVAAGQFLGYFTNSGALPGYESGDSSAPFFYLNGSDPGTVQNAYDEQPGARLDFSVTVQYVVTPASGGSSNGSVTAATLATPIDQTQLPLSGTSSANTTPANVTRTQLLSESFAGTVLPSYGQSSNSAWTANSGLVSPASGGGYNQLYTLSREYAVDQRTSRVTFKVGAVGAILGFGYSLAPAGNDGAGWGVLFVVDTNANVLTVSGPYSGGENPGVAASTPITFSLAAGRTYALTVSQNHAVHTAQLTDPVSGVSVSVTVGSNTSTGTQSIAVDLPTFVCIAGPFTVTNLTILANLKSPHALLSGDSLVYGYEQAQAGTWANRLQVQLPGQIGVSGRIGGNSAALLQRLTTEAAYLRPAIQFLGSGTNDANESVSTATFAANMQASVNAAKANGSRVVIMTLAPATGNNYAPPSTIAAYNNALMALTQVDAFLRVDLAVTQNNDGVTQNPACYASDGIHYSDTGGAAIAGRIPVDVPWLFD